MLHNGPLQPEQVLWLAFLSGPRGSVLGSWSALAFDGLRTRDAIPAHVVIPDGARRPRLDGPLAATVLSRSTALGPADVHPRWRPARTRPARSLVDAAIRASSPDQARVVLMQGIQTGVTRVSDLRAALERRGQRRYLDVLRQTLDDLDGGVRSVPEREFSALIRDHRLPAPARQAVLLTSDGRSYLDADWPAHQVGAEVHGIHHAAAPQLERDWRRHNLITTQSGRRMLHFTAHDVRHHRETVADVLATALAVESR